jgi:hypothetical protein
LRVHPSETDKPDCAVTPPIAKGETHYPRAFREFVRVNAAGSIWTLQASLGNAGSIQVPVEGCAQGTVLIEMPWRASPGCHE